MNYSFPSIYFLLYVIFESSLHVDGHRIRAQGRSLRAPLAYPSSASITKRAQAVGLIGTTDVSNSQDVIYTSKVTVGGVDVELQIDTGRWS
jgi:hypothetical protein